MKAERVQELKDLVGALSAEPTESLYWLCHEDGSQSEEVYCKSCADEQAKKQAGTDIDGGWSWESDTTRECEKCGVHLRCWPTDCGAREAIEAAKAHAPETPEDWWELRWAMEGLIASNPLWETIENMLQSWGIDKGNDDGS